MSKKRAKKHRGTLGDQHLTYWRRHLYDGFTGYVYVMRIGKRGAVKVGYAKNPTMRLKTLQTGTPGEYRLLLVVPGEKDLEAALHRRFAQHRVQGEWFAGDGVAEVINFVHDLAVEMVQAHKPGNERPPRWQISPLWSAAERSRFGMIHIKWVFDDSPVPKLSQEELKIARAGMSAEPSFVPTIADRCRRQALLPTPSSKNAAPLSQ